MNKNKQFIKKYFGESIFDYDYNLNLTKLSKAIKNKNFMITGASGSIGSAYVKLLLNFEPKKLFLIDINENSLVELLREIRSSSKINTKIDIYCLDITSSDFDFIFKKNKVHFIANFAAMKHVRSEENIVSILRMIDVNIQGTINLLNLAKKYRIKNFFSVSTDKSADPINIMGATKNFMEKIMFNFSDKITVTSARFANVLFSNGSIINSIEKKISNIQPIAFPRYVKRFFISLDEAAQISLIASVLGKNKNIYIPKAKLRKPVEIKKVIFNYLNFNRIQPKIFYNEKNLFKHQITPKAWSCLITEPNTSGEKIEEIYHSKSEVKVKCEFESIDVIKIDQNLNQRSLNYINSSINSLRKNEKLNKKKLITFLKKYIQNFNHKEMNKSLNSRL